MVNVFFTETSQRDNKNNCKITSVTIIKLEILKIESEEIPDVHFVTFLTLDRIDHF